jgi:hypothetical protein
MPGRYSKNRIQKPRGGRQNSCIYVDTDLERARITEGTAHKTGYKQLENHVADLVLWTPSFPDGG